MKAVETYIIQSIIFRLLNVRKFKLSHIQELFCYNRNPVQITIIKKKD